VDKFRTPTVAKHEPFILTKRLSHCNNSISFYKGTKNKKLYQKIKESDIKEELIEEKKKRNIKKHIIRF